MRRKSGEYHTGRLNISCPPSVKDSIARDATQHGLSISQYIVELYEKSREAGSSEHLARVGLDLLGLKKGLLEVDTRLKRAAARNGGLMDQRTASGLAQLHDLQQRVDVAIKETVDAVKILKEQGK